MEMTSFDKKFVTGAQEETSEYFWCSQWCKLCQNDIFVSVLYLQRFIWI